MIFNLSKIKNYLIPKQEILNIEISDFGVRFFSFYQNKIYPKVSYYEPLAPQVVTKGILEKPEVLKAVFERFKNKFMRSFRSAPYVIMSLPSSLFYINIITLPEVVEEELEEAVRLNAEMNSPISLNNAYFDWQKINIPLAQENHSENIFITVVQKDLIDPYLNIIKAAGFELGAVEMQSLSLARFLYNTSKIKEPYLAISVKRDGIEMILGQFDTLIFFDFDAWSEIAPTKKLNELTLDDIKEYLKESLPKFLNFSQARYHKTIGYFYLMTETPATTKLLFDFIIQNYQLKPLSLKLPLGLKNVTFDWFIVIGAAIRGLIPRGSDMIVSLTPIGTEEAYIQNRTLGYASFWARNVTAFLFGMLVIIAALNFTFFKTTLNSLKNQLNTLSSAATLSPKYQTLISQSEEFNDLVSKITVAKANEKNWHEIFAELFSLTSQNNINIDRLFISSLSGQITLQGSAATREVAANFKDLLNKAHYFTNVSMPLTSFSESANRVSFTLNFNLRF